MTPLGKLIEQWSADPRFGRQRALADAAGISKSNLSRMKLDEPLKTIVPGALRGLSRATGVALQEIVKAALVSAGLPDVYEDRTLAQHIWGDPDLSNAAKQMLIGALDAAVPPAVRRAAAAHPNLGDSAASE